MSANNQTERSKDLIPENPFPGLRPFRTDESHLFFGRRRQSDEVIQKLLQNRFCAVTGASGSGKSSLIYCGVITSLQNDTTVFSGRWKTIIFRPGNFPTTSLLQKLGINEKTGSQEIIENPEDITYQLKKLNPVTKDPVLVIIDQFEEVFRFSESDQPGNINSPFFFSRALAELVKQNDIPVYLIITMRSDFIGDCSRFPELTALINSSNYLVPRLAIEDFREVIEAPIATVGAKISKDLVNRIIEDLGDNPDHLPVLQHALMRTWNYWKLHNDSSKPLSFADYDAVGRMEKALSEHANEAYGELNEREKVVCEKIFRTLTEKGQFNKGVRKPSRFDKLLQITMASRDEAIRVLDIFRSQGRSFITPSIDVSLTDDTVVDISHESFMRIWDRLRVWVDEEASSIQMYKRLAESSYQYQLGRSGLWRPPDLHLAVNWRRKNNPTLAWAERHNPAFERTMAFLEASERKFNEEEENKIRLQKLRLRRTRLFAMVLGTAAIISMGLFIWTRELRVTAEREFQRAEIQRQLAELKTLEATQQRELAERAAQEAFEQRAFAEEQSIIAEEQRLQAEQMADEAKRQTALATLNLSEANRQRSLALSNEKEAQDQKEQALMAREEAFQRRMLTVARSLAVKSLQVTADSDLKALLAYQAYNFNERFNGFSNDVDIYTGLYQALKLLMGSEWNVYSGHSDAVLSVSFIPESNTFISAGSDGKILKWDIDDTTKNYSIVADGRNHIEAIKISPDGEWLVCAENKTGILLYNLTDLSRPPLVLNGADNQIRALAFSPDSKNLFSAGLTNTIEYWNLSEGISRSFANPGSRVNSLSLSPDGVLLLGGTKDGKVIMWRAKGETIASEIYNDPVNSVQSVAFAPDYRYLACGNISGEILIFRADNFELIRILSGHKARITDLSFSPDGKMLASASFDGNIVFWNMDDLTSPPVILNDHSGFAFSVAFSSNGKHTVSGSSDGHRVISRPASSILLTEPICKLVSRNLSPEEWNAYVGEDIPYEETCRIRRRFSIDIEQLMFSGKEK